VFERPERSVWSRLERQVQAFLQPLAAAGTFGPPDAPDAFLVVCDERINGAADVAAGRTNLLVSLRGARAGQWRTFLVTHSRSGSRVAPARSHLLPPETRMTLGAADADAAADAEDTQRRQTLAQALFGHYGEPRPPVSGVVGERRPEAAASRGLDPETIARFHRDIGRRPQRY